MLERVFVTGMGVLCSIGHDRRSFASALRKGTSGITRLGADSPPPVRIAAPIRDFEFGSVLERRAGLPESLIQHAKRCVFRSPLPIQVSAAVALEAWQAAHLHEAAPDSDRIALVVAGQNLSQNYQFGLAAKFRQKPAYLTPRYALHYLDTDQVGTLSEVLGIRGEGFTVGGASASGNVAIINGCRLIQQGLADVCLVVGAMADLSPMEYQGFHGIGAMGGRDFGDDPDRASRPFDRRSEGFIHGQGSGCLVLESRDSLRRRVIAEPLAEIAGGSICLDGNRLSDPSITGEQKAMETALLRSIIQPEGVDYLNAHGTSSPLGDRTEVEAIGLTFGKNLSQLRVNATKGLIGHCLYAAGVVEAIATVIQMREGFLHPNLNLDNPIETSLKFCGPTAQDAEISVSMSNSFGFGGFNTSLIFKKGETP